VFLDRDHGSARSYQCGCFAGPDGRSLVADSTGSDTGLFNCTWFPCIRQVVRFKADPSWSKALCICQACAPWLVHKHMCVCTSCHDGCVVVRHNRSALESVLVNMRLLKPVDLSKLCVAQQMVRLASCKSCHLEESVAARLLNRPDSSSEMERPA
jgi:hypothetical protein